MPKQKLVKPVPKPEISTTLLTRCCTVTPSHQLSAINRKSADIQQCLRDKKENPNYNKNDLKKNKNELKNKNKNGIDVILPYKLNKNKFFNDMT